MWTVLLAFIFQFFMLLLFKINPLSSSTYRGFSEYWNRGGVLQGKDIFMLLTIFAYLPLCVYGCYKLYHYKYMRLLTIPLSKLVNRGLDDYVAPEVNIKNLKIEEKKTLEQIVQERIEQEKKRSQSENNPIDFRKKIIEQINEAKK